MEGISVRGYRAPFTRRAGQAVLAQLDIHRHVREHCGKEASGATGMSEARSEGTLRERERPEARKSSGPAEAVCGVVKRRVPRTSARREPCDESGAHEARVLVVESVGKQMSVRRIARPFCR